MCWGCKDKFDTPLHSRNFHHKVFCVLVKVRARGHRAKDNQLLWESREYFRRTERFFWVVEDEEECKQLDREGRPRRCKQHVQGHRYAAVISMPMSLLQKPNFPIVFSQWRLKKGLTGPSVDIMEVPYCHKEHSPAVSWAPPLLFPLPCVTLNQSLSASGSQFPCLVIDGSGMNHLANSSILFCFSVLFDEKLFPSWL